MHEVKRSLKAILACSLAIGLSGISSQAYAVAAESRGFRCGGPFFDASFCDRDDVIEQLRGVEPRSINEVSGAAFDLIKAYSARAERQQKIVDFSSGFTVLGALGYIFMGGAAQTTAGYVALAPMVSGTLNANEPTRDLYEASATAMALIVARYEIISKAQPDFAAIADEAEACELTFPSLTGVPANAAAFLRGQDHQMYDICRRIGVGYAQMTIMGESLARPHRSLERLYAEDVLSFEQRVLMQDRRLRYSPAKSLKMVLSAPLRSLDSLVSGDETEKAIAFFKTSQSLAGLNIRLNRIAVHSAPRSIELSAFENGNGEAELQSTSPENWQKLVTARAALQKRLHRYNNDVQFAQSIEATANATDFKFTVDPESETVRVELVSPASP